MSFSTREALPRVQTNPAAAAARCRTLLHRPAKTAPPRAPHCQAPLPGETRALVYALLSEHATLRQATGCRVARDAQLGDHAKKVSAELGGKSAILVFNDAGAGALS